VTIPVWLPPVLIAPFVGSFLGVVSARWERPLSIVRGRSACSACGVTLGPRDLIPMVSWIAAQGHCRHCNSAVSRRYPAIEIGAIVIAAWAVVAVPASELWFTVALGWGLLALAVTDIENYVLPDFLTLPLLALGLIEAWSVDSDALAARLAGSCAGIAFVLVLRFLYFRLRGAEGMGLGDAKLLGVAGGWTGWEGLPTILFLSATLALVAAAWRARATGKISLTDRVPYGASLCFAIWIVSLHGPLGIAK
jgi:leader peptidase (prepilin peptidase)/N-methyltransferase